MRTIRLPPRRYSFKVTLLNGTTHTVAVRTDDGLNKAENLALAKIRRQHRWSGILTCRLG